MRDLAGSFSAKNNFNRRNPLRLVVLILVVLGILFLAKTFLDGIGSGGFGQTAELKDASTGLTPVTLGNTQIAGGVNLKTETITLKDVKYGGAAKATATRAYGGGVFRLDVSGTLPDPVNVNYEVWLTGSGSVLPIDVMTGSKTSWSLGLSDNDKYSQYTGILITLQRNKASGIPEEHVMEGSF